MVEAIVCTALVCITLAAMTIILTVKGITYHKKMYIVPPPVPETPRTPEMDEAERLLNEVDKVNARNNAENDKRPPDSKGPAMDRALRNLREVFGPENQEELTDGE